MINPNIRFYLEERPNVFRKSGIEYALNIQLGDSDGSFLDLWTMKTWESKPSEKTINDTKELIMRSFEFYHRHLHIPQFNINEIE
jgi:hypothetical protein